MGYMQLLRLCGRVVPTGVPPVELSTTCAHYMASVALPGFLVSLVLLAFVNYLVFAEHWSGYVPVLCMSEPEYE